jgi:hypothetical protein
MSALDFLRHAFNWLSKSAGSGKSATSELSFYVLPVSFSMQKHSSFCDIAG